MGANQTPSCSRFAQTKFAWIADVCCKVDACAAAVFFWGFDKRFMQFMRDQEHLYDIHSVGLVDFFGVGQLTFASRWIASVACRWG